MNTTDPCAALDKPSWRVALEDAAIVGAAALFSGLISAGAVWPPEATTLYATGLTAALAGIIAWARKRQIETKVEEAG